MPAYACLSLHRRGLATNPLSPTIPVAFLVWSGHHLPKGDRPNAPHDPQRELGDRLKAGGDPPVPAGRCRSAVPPAPKGCTGIAVPWTRPTRTHRHHLHSSRSLPPSPSLTHGCVSTAVPSVIGIYPQFLNPGLLWWHPPARDGVLDRLGLI